MGNRWYRTDHVSDGSTLYIGGIFHEVGPNTPYGAYCDRNTGLVSSTLMTLTTEFDALFRMEMGGLYIGGSFTKIYDQSRVGLAHLDANHQLTSWAPSIGANSTVSCLPGRKLHFIGGNFTYVNGTFVSGIAAIDATSGTGVPSNCIERCSWLYGNRQ